MAYASNQVGSSSFPSSSTPHWNHHVFLSFRGTDTRNNFTSHLYTALKDAGIKTFIDDEELSTGKSIKPELQKAIRESRMSIIVFSENYASSRWCLDELVEIIECKRTMGQLVFPLFYDVKPSVVRHQTESYEKAFQHFVTESDKSKVKNWRAALKEAADLSGHDLADEENGNEARFIAKIVRKVQLEVNLRCLNVSEYLIGVDSHVNCINMLLSIGSDDVRTIGIFGMGGIGKTTVSKVVYNKHLNHFEGSAFLENIKDVSKLSDGLLRLQNNLLSQLQKKEIKLSNSDEGINQIKNICCSKRVLILLDDLEDLNQVNQLAGQKSWFSTGSRIIMVTRNAKLLKEAHVDHDHMYEMKVLDEDKSLELFRRHAIGEETPSEDHILLSRDITRYCGGLPLALEVIGSHLHRESLMYWKNALKEFQSKPHKTIQDRLKISYDALRAERKKIFLDVACFFIGWETKYVVKFWDGCRFNAENSIRDLLDKCLLKFDENNCLWMHDHLRDMGRAIVLEASDRSLKKHSRVWIHEEVRDLLQHPKGAEAVEGIHLDLPYSQSIDLNTKAFEAMKELRFLLIKNVDVIGSFEHLFGKLRWLSWECCPLKSLPSNFHPRELVVLNLKYSKIKKLWERVKYLNNLKILDLSYSESLVETPNFFEVRNLECLMLRGCKRLSTIDPSICELRSLEELDLEGCSKLKRLPEKLGNMKSLKTLNVNNTLLEGLPDSIGQLSKLVHLRLRLCKELKTLPTTICNLMSLEELDVFDCSKLEQLPEELGNLECLLDLDLSMCNLINLPASTCNMTSLEKINVNRCSNLKRLPEGMGNLKRLRTLNASETGLEELPDSIGHLSSLVHLDLSGCRNLRTLPDCICDLSSLEVLNIDGCNALQQLPELLGNMVSLRNLDVYGVQKCQQLPDSIKNLKKLETFSLGRLRRDPQLSTFKRFVLPLNSSLKRLDLGCCGLHDEDIPDDIGICLLSLQFLDLSGNDFCYLPSTLCQLSNLTVLYLSKCESLVSLPELPPNLLRLYASGCTAMENIPNLSNLTHLQDLNLSDCNRLAEVQGIENLKLRFLNMAGCDDLATFNESFFQRYFERADYESSISLPKWSFQNWIIYQSMESTISFELPRSLPHNFRGIILWVVYAHCSSKFYRANITNNTSGKYQDHYRHNDICCLVGFSWVSCIKSKYFRSGDSIKISISEDENVKVEKCGVHWFIGSEGDEDENVHYDDDEEEETERVYDDHNPTETDQRDVKFKRCHCTIL